MGKRKILQSENENEKTLKTDPAATRIDIVDTGPPCVSIPASTLNRKYSIRLLKA